MYSTNHSPHVYNYLSPTEILSKKGITSSIVLLSLWTLKLAYFETWQYWGKVSMLSNTPQVEEVGGRNQSPLGYVAFPCLEMVLNNVVVLISTLWVCSLNFLTERTKITTRCYILAMESIAIRIFMNQSKVMIIFSLAQLYKEDLVKYYYVWIPHCFSHVSGLGCEENRARE